MTGDVRHEYGVHAYKTPEQATEYANSYLDHPFSYIWLVWHRQMSGDKKPYTPPQEFVVGSVLLWGEVVEHERGYRAEFAKIASLDAALTEGPDIESLRKRLTTR